jgi:hypothetical protein
MVFFAGSSLVLFNSGNDNSSAAHEQPRVVERRLLFTAEIIPMKMHLCSTRFGSPSINWKFIVALTLLIAFRPAVLLADEPSPSQIEDTIKKGKAYLYSKQANGNWEAVAAAKPSAQTPNDPGGFQYGGLTALAVFALLSCGDTPQSNDNLKAAVEWLKKADMRGTYSLALRAQVWNLLADEQSSHRIEKRDMDLLLAGVRTKGEANGFFSYGEGVDLSETGSSADHYDHSCSQFGVLGIWALNQAGFEVNSKYWKLFDAGWRDHQQPDGAWCYQAHPILDPRIQMQDGLRKEELSMTAAGVATLFITQDYVNTSSRCEGNVKDRNIEAGMAWIGEHLKDIEANEWAASWQYYTLFGICRIGQASGYKYFGTTNWFQWGADRLMKSQDPNGGWGPANASMSFGLGTASVDPQIYDSSLALLFLSRGRAPVLFNKLQYDLVRAGSKKPVEGNWNQRPRDIANLTRFIGKEREISMNWEIVNLQQPVDDMLDAPMLYMAGNQTLKLSPQDVEKLRSYVNQGGIIIGHSDCSASAFNESFKKLGEAMFPGTAFRELPADHPICTLESFSPKNWSPKPKVEILDNGARLRMLLLANGDPARDWQTQSFIQIKKYTFGQLLMDIYLYSVDKQPPRTKGDTFLVKREELTDPTTTAKVARLQYTGNWDPEPGGWPRLANIVHNKNKLDITITPIELGKGLLTKDFKLADLTGTDTLKLTDAQLAELKAYVDGGGTLLIDAAGGKSAFVTSAQAALLKAFPGTTAPAVLPADSPVYALGDPIKEVAYRQFARMTLGSLHSPQLRGLKTGDRIGVFFSNEDVAVGLVGQPVDGILGYDPESAAHVVQNILLYATK